LLSNYTSENLAKSVNEIVSELIPTIQRGKIAQSSLKNNGFIGICKTNSDMIKLANILAPEHLQIMTKSPESISSKITSSGLVLIGNDTPVICK
jgi:Histidinol dehydrogenase